MSSAARSSGIRRAVLYLATASLSSLYTGSPLLAMEPPRDVGLQVKLDAHEQVVPRRIFAGSLDLSDRMGIVEFHFVERRLDGSWSRGRTPWVRVQRVDPESLEPVRPDAFEAQAVMLFGAGDGEVESRQPHIYGNWVQLHGRSHDGGMPFYAGRSYRVTLPKNPEGVIVRIPEDVRPGELLRAYVDIGQQVPSEEPAPPQKVPRADIFPLEITITREFLEHLRSFLVDPQGKRRPSREILAFYGVAGAHEVVELEMDGDGTFQGRASRMGGELVIVVVDDGYFFPVLYRRSLGAPVARIPAAGDALFQGREKSVFVFRPGRPSPNASGQPMLTLFADRSGEAPLYGGLLIKSRDQSGPGEEPAFPMLCRPGRYWARISGYYGTSDVWEGEVLLQARPGAQSENVRIGP